MPHLSLAILPILLLYSLPLSASKILVYCPPTYPKMLNPQKSLSNAVSDSSLTTIYNRLVHYRPDGTIAPDLAKSWKVDPTGKIYTFSLHQSVNFHQNKDFSPTRPLNAQDVLFSFQRQIDPTHRYHSINGNSYPYARLYEWRNHLTKIEAIDHYAIRFTLKKRNENFLHQLASAGGVIYSQEYANHLQQSEQMELIDTFPIGTGPFLLKKLVPNRMIRFESHKKYFQGEAQMEKLVFSITPDQEKRYQKINTGECQIIADPPGSKLTEIKLKKELNISSVTASYLYGIQVNTRSKHFKSSYLRLALYYAVNRQQLIESVFQGQAFPLNHLSLGLYQKGAHDIFDLSKAKRYTELVNTTKLKLKLSHDKEKRVTSIANLLKQFLHDLGLNVVNERETDTILLEKIPLPHLHPLVFYTPRFRCHHIKTGLNPSRWCYEKFDRLIGKLEREGDHQTLKKQLTTANKYFFHGMPWIPLFRPLLNFAYRSKIKNFSLDPLGNIIFHKTGF